VITLRYTPGENCLELKSLKMYWLAYRNLGIFQENIVNKFLRDVVKYADPIRATVIGDFTPRGGIATIIRASYERKKGSKRGR
jgi:7-cyano-7-deazaguanine reductase